MAWLFDQGLLDYDARIAEYWPQVDFFKMLISIYADDFFAHADIFADNFYSGGDNLITLLPIFSVWSKWERRHHGG